MISGLAGRPLTLVPTAKALRAEVATTSWTWALPVFGAATLIHARPFQRIITGRLGPSTKALVAPTAQAERADRTVTPNSQPLRSGAGTRRHALPFQCRISVLSVPTTSVPPTATLDRIPPDSPDKPVL